MLKLFEVEGWVGCTQMYIGPWNKRFAPRYIFCYILTVRDHTHERYQRKVWRSRNRWTSRLDGMMLQDACSLCTDWRWRRTTWKRRAVTRRPRSWTWPVTWKRLRNALTSWRDFASNKRVSWKTLSPLRMMWAKTWVLLSFFLFSSVGGERKGLDVLVGYTIVILLLSVRE